MSKKTLRLVALLSAVAGLGLAGLTLVPGTAQAAELPPGCYRHPITGALICPYPPPY
ncbi:hypothetical protein ACLESO_21355 [Pyxidicoccus sp. 3LG]|uniref:hypothetical protein n=1 Tax=Pyxidicoccus xibeiensis TaxID=2906759 RepID=UPI0020A743AB|nr:hypothetical protein [Pyxidicoccus xibeiensis]MCP3140461.1 hypothetical protein [Pyxidicoccus xibeiensis]